MNSFVKLYHCIWYHSVIGLCSIISKIWLPVNVTGRENLVRLKALKNKGGWVVVSNHDSHFDVVLLPYACKKALPRLRFFASHDLIEKETQQKRYAELFSTNPKWKKNFYSRFIARFTVWFVKSSRSILVNRDSDKIAHKINREAVLAGKHVLEENGALCVFPDAGIDRNEARGSAFALAKSTDSVIIPVHIRRKPKPWNRRNPWQVTIGTALETCTIEVMAKQGQTPTEALMSHIRCL